MKFEKSNDTWTSIFSVESFTLDDHIKIYKEKYASVLIDAKWSCCKSIGNQPTISFYKLVLKFEDVSDEASFILSESL